MGNRGGTSVEYRCPEQWLNLLHHNFHLLLYTHLHHPAYSTMQYFLSFYGSTFFFLFFNGPVVSWLLQFQFLIMVHSLIHPTYVSYSPSKCNSCHGYGKEMKEEEDLFPGFRKSTLVRDEEGR